jgi:Domain of unknown function (DUF4276)
MSQLRVAPIVEGDGEFACVRILLQRVWYEMLGGEYISVVQPVKEHRAGIVKEDVLRKAVRSAALKLKKPPTSNDPALVLILIDANKDCPRELGPKLLEIARQVYPVTDVACILAKVEYETCFAAAADSLSEYFDLSSHPPASEAPEEARHGKAWVEQRFRKTKQRSKYTEPRDQPAMTSAMNLNLCRQWSPSFDKLCRDLEQRLRRPNPGS